MIKALLAWLGQQSINWFVNGKIEVMWTWYF